MNYDFTSLVNRKNTGAAKWELMYQANPNCADDVVPLSVADMEFQLAPEIRKGLINFLQNEDVVLGYTLPTDDYLEAVVSWQKRRHQVEIEKEWIVNTPGIITALNAGLRAVTQENDGVIIFRPVYYPFGLAIDDNTRKEVNIPLLHNNGDYTIDFEQFEKAAADPKNKVLVFCNPHNPVGRVWTREELEKIADICIKHELYVISDDIWNDLIMPGHTFTYLADVNPELTPYVMTFTAASKSFNLAGMITSNILIEDEDLREIFKAELVRSRYDQVGTLGYESTRLAYEEAEAWLDEAIQVILKNSEVVQSFFAENYPKVTTYLPEGTYVQWLDFSALGLDDVELERFLQQDCQFFANSGYIFGTEGSGFVRINLAVPTGVLTVQLERLLKVLLAKDKNE